MGWDRRGTGDGVAPDRRDRSTGDEDMDGVGTRTGWGRGTGDGGRGTEGDETGWGITVENRRYIINYVQYKNDRSLSRTSRPRAWLELVH